jgi:pimeloyl-ACP methyl ester carboxylesterase
MDTQCVFIHGLGQKPSSWDKVISNMPESIHVECPDLFSLARTNETTYPNLYRAFSDYCGALPEKLNLCGLSLGGVLALHYAIDNPERVRSLTLIGTQYKMPKTLLKLQNVIFRIMPRFVFKRQGVEKQEFLKTFLGLMNTMTNLDFSGDLGNVVCDTLIICGDKDSANKNAAKCLADNIPKAKFQLLKNTGHEANADNPEGLAAALTEFLRGEETI